MASEGHSQPSQTTPSDPDGKDGPFVNPSTGVPSGTATTRSAAISDKRNEPQDTQNPIDGPDLWDFSKDSNLHREVSDVVQSSEMSHFQRYAHAFT